MISKEYLEVIKIIHAKMSKIGIDWYVVGKANLALQGIDVNPSRLGILIHDVDLNSFLELFSDCERTEVFELDNGEAKEFVMKINNVEVLVCAEYPHGIFWIVMKGPKLFLIDDLAIPCFSLESDREAYFKLGKDSKVKLIDDFLKKK